MKPHRFPLCCWLLIVVGLVGTAATTETLAQPPEPGARGFLLLRNGNLLEGRIYRLADFYQVEVPHGQLRIREKQVETFCHTRDQAYQHRRARQAGSTADSHLELASWCLRQNMLPHAARELLEARAIDSDHPRLGQLERRLRQTLQRADSVTAPPRAVSADQTQGQTEPVNMEHLARFSPESRAEFVRVVQPLLVQSCATSGCHQAADQSGLQLDRLAVEGVGHPDLTRDNLASVGTTIDWDVPEESPLLKQAILAHGEARGAVSQPLTVHQLELLETWVSAATDKKPAAVHAQTETPPVHVAPVAEFPAPLIHDSEVQAATRNEPLIGEPNPRDPFDPEVFNRRFREAADPPTPTDRTTPAAAPQEPSE